MIACQKVSVDCFSWYFVCVWLLWLVGIVNYLDTGVKGLVGMSAPFL